MALPSSGFITAAMINQELGRALTAPFNINDPLIREIAGKPSGSIKFSDLHGKSYEIVKRITASGAGPDVIKNLFTASEWASKRPKRVIINSGVEIGGNGYGYALAVTDNASGQAGSFAGRLILENHGFISGRGGAANGGAGQDALLANFLGRDGNKLEIYNYGTIRGGGGGGGRGGNGGTGGGGSHVVFTKEPASGFRYNYDTDYYYIYSGSSRRWVWNGTLVSTSSGNPTVGGWTYYRGNLKYHDNGRETNDGNRVGQWSKYEIRREGNVTTNTNGGAGGAGGNGGRGQGFGQARANGAGGAAGAAGGTNAGRGGTGGTGGNGGDWGAAGAAGNSGATGAAGNRTSGAAGAGGAAGGAAGCYINGNARVTWHVTGTRQGRAV